MKAFARFILYTLLGWKTVGSFPKDLKKYVLIAAPHTHWLDFPLGVAIKYAEGLPANYIGKASLFKPLQTISVLRSRLNLSRNWRGVSSSLNEIRRLIMANVGIGALPLHVAQQDVAAGHIRQLPPYEDLPEVSIFLITNPARRYSEAELAFLSMIETEISRFDISERTYGK